MINMLALFASIPPALTWLFALERYHFGFLWHLESSSGFVYSGFFDWLTSGATFVDYFEFIFVGHIFPFLCVAA